MIMFRFPLAVLLVGIASLNLSKAADSAAPADDASIRKVITLVAHHQIHPLVDGDYSSVETVAALKAARPPEGLAWLYPWGVTLYGMLRTSEVTGDDAPAQFALQHSQVAARYYTFLESERTKLGAPAIKDLKTPINQLMALGNLDSCGAMGVAMLDGVLHHPEQETPEVKAVLARIADWIVHRQQRMPDGTLCRPLSGKGPKAEIPGTLWCDDLYMACPFLVRWSQYTGDSRYLDDAAQQIIHQAALLQDTDGVWYHAYYLAEHRRSTVKWGRANGWVVVALAEVLSALPPDHPARAQLLAILQKDYAGLKPLQASSGMWRQVLDHPELWEETSCTAMFAYGFARAAHRGWIEPGAVDVARRAFTGISAQVMPDGSVNGTCIGTGIGPDLAFYVARKRPPDDLHGRGVVQLAGAEILAGGK